MAIGLWHAMRPVLSTQSAHRGIRCPHVREEASVITRILCGAGYAVVPFLSPQMRGGWRAKWRNHCSFVPRSLSRTRAPLGAPSRRSPSGIGRALRGIRTPCWSAVSQAPGGQPVLAAGRSSDAARVRALRGTSAGAASDPAHMRAPSGGPDTRTIFSIGKGDYGPFFRSCRG